MRRSICRSCGEVVFWFKKPDGNFHRPVDELEHGIWVIDDVVQPTSMTVYKFHYCDEEKVEIFKVKAIRDDVLQREYLEARNKAREEGLKYPCPKCDAAIGEACINISMKKKDLLKKTVWPHTERMPHAVGDQEVP